MYVWANVSVGLHYATVPDQHTRFLTCDNYSLHDEGHLTIADATFGPCQVGEWKTWWNRVNCRLSVFCQGNIIYHLRQVLKQTLCYFTSR